MFEVEIKSLPQTKEKADKLIKLMRENDPKFKLVSQSKQRNHYFEDGNINELLKNLSQVLSKKDLLDLEEILKKGTNYTVRTRQSDDSIIFVLKATVGSSKNKHHGNIRYEYEKELKNITLKQLDKIIINSGFKYQSKWSRERKEYTYLNINVCVDKNAGYGYLVEFEKVAEDEKQAGEVRKEILKKMKNLGVKELSDKRLSRMFAFYSANWEKYYETEKVFNVD
jgi:predicted adenylyl cyclase CyaB